MSALAARITSLEAKSGVGAGARKLVSATVHESMSNDARDDFLRVNGVDPRDSSNLILFVTRLAGTLTPPRINCIIDLR